jgi:inhibitor of cysteine peptidase
VISPESFMSGTGRFLLTSALLIGTALLMGCNSDGVKLDEGQNRSTVTVRSGQTFTLHLKSNPTTGYRWELVECDDAVVCLVKEHFTPSSEVGERSGARKVGAGGVQTFAFIASKLGQTTLKLVYRRSWEKDVEPLQTFIVTVRVE